MKKVTHTVELLEATVLFDGMHDSVQAALRRLIPNGEVWVNGALFGICAVWLQAQGKLTDEGAQALYASLCEVMEDSLPPGDGPPDLNAYADGLLARAQEEIARA